MRHWTCFGKVERLFRFSHHIPIDVTNPRAAITASRWRLSHRVNVGKPIFAAILAGGALAMSLLFLSFASASGRMITDDSGGVVDVPDRPLRFISLGTPI
ncbi:hypothetical protein EDF70_103453 [Neorhizobium sp. JUb45]|nr:hypothetical protein EDF70_103453 [Neorhizobium sp. JUb45]